MSADTARTADERGVARPPSDMLDGEMPAGPPTEAMRHAVMTSAAELARSANADEVIPKILMRVGLALGACRMQLYQNAAQAGTEPLPTQRYAWNAEQCASATDSILALALPDIDRLMARLANGESVQVPSHGANGALRHIMQAVKVTTSLFVPVSIDGRWWGELEVDRNADETEWSRDAIDVSTITAGLIGAAIARAQAEKELADAARIIENSAAFLFRITAQQPHKLTYISPNIGRYGYSVRQILTAPTRIFDYVHPEDFPKLLEDIIDVSEGKATETSSDIRLRAADGRYLWFDCRMSAVPAKDNDTITEIEGLAIDIDRRKTTESYIAHFTLTDQLTGLANRTAFMDELRHAFAAAKRGANAFAVLYIDLDHFKDINDVLGHSKGDMLLKHVANRLQGSIRIGDFLARFGGDEFAILQANITDPSDAGTLAARVLRDLTETPYDLGTQVDVTASIGIAFFGPDSADAEEMFKHADMALYRAKDLGRNQFHFHSEALDVAIIERVTLAGDLRRGLDRGEFELQYQPEVDARSGRIVGIEALARWHHPKHGLLQPSHFIPIAEKTGAILPFGRWVINQVCRQIIAWRGDKLAPPRVSLNVSALQLKSAPAFDADLMQILATWGVEPSAIELELTESVLMATTREHREIIDRLNALGVAIAIDDFGTGYSSLGYLRAYRVSHIKIAQDFIQHIEEGSGDVAIVRAAISLGRELGIKVIAEGVETAFQLKLLVDAGCPYIQGYYFAAPLPATRMTDLLLQEQPFPPFASPQDRSS